MYLAGGSNYSQSPREGSSKHEMVMMRMTAAMMASMIAMMKTLIRSFSLIGEFLAGVVVFYSSCLTLCKFIGIAVVISSLYCICVSLWYHMVIAYMC